MNSLEKIKVKIQKLYKKNPNVHINVALSKPKILLKNESAVIKGVYPHIFLIEEYSSGSPKTYALQYTEVLTNHIEIIELLNNSNMS